MAPAEYEVDANRHRSRAVSVWLADEDVDQLKRIAQEKGIGHTTLIRMWVKANLQKENREGASGP